MAYVAFSLKWRPQSFDDVVGQEHAITTLKNAITAGRLANAYLFAGPRGVGKTSVARILAKSLNCINGPTATPCQKCPSCLGITSGRSLDCIEIDGASNRGIDEIRVLRENVKFAPVQGKFKVYIIDEVHMLTAEAFNALLKTLEEPPEFVKFIFATTHPHKVIPTILSRCQRFDFLRIPNVTIIKQLEKIVAGEHIALDRDVFFALAKASDGSLRDAESMLDQLISFNPGKLSSRDVNSVLGIIEQDSLFEMANTIIRKDAVAALRLLDTLMTQGKDAGIFLQSLIEHFRNIMVAKVLKERSPLFDVPEQYADMLLAQSNAFTLEEIFFTFNLLVNTQEACRRFGSARIPIEVALVKLAHDKRKADVSFPQPPPLAPTPPAEMGKAAASPPVNVPPVENGPTQPLSDPPDEGALNKIQGSWSRVIDEIGSSKMSIATYLREGELRSVMNNTLTIAFPRNNSLHKEMLERKDNRALIEKTLQDIVQMQVKVQCVLADDVVKKQETPDTGAIQQVMNAFGGRLIREE